MLRTARIDNQGYSYPEHLKKLNFKIIIKPNYARVPSEKSLFKLCIIKFLSNCRRRQSDDWRDASQAKKMGC